MLKKDYTFFVCVVEIENFPPAMAMYLERLVLVTRALLSHCSPSSCMLL